MRMTRGSDKECPHSSGAYPVSPAVAIGTVPEPIGALSGTAKRSTMGRRNPGTPKSWDISRQFRAHEH